MILVAGVLNWKTIIVILGLVILIYGFFLGPKGKGTDSKHYDEKKKNVLEHHFKASEAGNDYIYKGSGRYRDSSGKVKKDK